MVGSPPLEPIGAYQPLFELGRGGMGAAFLSRALGADRFERLVVVKRLHPHLLGVPEAVERFMNEARLAAHVRHANVVGTQQVGRDDAGPYLVLDYVEGASLDELVDRAALRGRQLPPPVALRIALDVLAGLQAVHEATDSAGRHLQMLHRDVSLQNVLIGREGVARIADFGIAKSAFGSVVTDEQYLIGKLLYMPPEYLRRGRVDARLDIYSLGLTLWLMLAGRDLWPGASEGQLVQLVMSETLPAISQGALVVAPRIEALVARACAKQPEDRFGSAREMADAIEQIARDTGWLATHAEVALMLEELTGAELAERRSRLAALLQSGALPHAGVVTASAEVTSTGPTQIGRKHSAGRKARTWGLVGVAGIAAAVAFVLASRSSSNAPLAGSEPMASPLESAARLAAPPESASSAPRDSQPVAVVPSSSSHPAPSAGPATVAPRPRDSGPAPRKPPGPKAPDGISESNPYLR